MERATMKRTSPHKFSSLSRLGMLLHLNRVHVSIDGFHRLMAQPLPA
jgi:hypothetical protein